MPPVPGPLQRPLLRHFTTHKAVNIYGGGPSLRLAPFPKNADKWSVGSLFATLQSRVDLYFCLHDTDPIHLISKLEDVGYIDRNKYPLEKIMDRFGSRYFTNSISYMIALAIYRGYRIINIYGVDLEQTSEYTFERPSVAYWCGVAAGLGTTVNWPKINPFYLYGYEEKELRDILNLLKEKEEIAIAELEACKNEREKDQWRGFVYAIQTIAREVKS